MKNYPKLNDQADVFFRPSDGRVTIDRPNRARRDATGYTDRTYDPTPASRGRIERLVYGHDWDTRQRKPNGWIGLRHGPTPQLQRLDDAQ